MRIGLILLAMMAMGCAKEEQPCRDCVTKVWHDTVWGLQLVSEDAFTDCKGTVKDEDRTYQEGSIMKRKVTYCR